MRTTDLSRRFAAIVIAVGALAGLTACTGAPAPSNSSASTDGGSGDGGSGDGQTTEEACQLVSDTITSATDEFEQATDEDATVAAEAFHAAAQSIADASSQVTNEEVAALLPSLQELFENVADLLPAIIEGDTSKSEEFAQVGTDLQTTMQEFQELCAPAE
ncbi:hypothetical protein [Microbacterium sp. SSM24]|uniref:hypothetical protein n=1 Tax=Microbacterium sp. SSM24 TaxID=2991714 RepID=UPI00222780E3|nr:hypothetical protein [Microbacterium sp. SSM24]MCW3492225.1 hypothetical protein [Microbacterium sp. SSM24]